MSARRTGTASVAALLAVALVAVGLDDCLGLRAQEELRLSRADAENLEDLRVRVLRECELTARAAARVAAGTLTLAAVDELEPVHRARPGVECAWPSDPPPTLRHGVARSVIARVAGDLEADPARRATVLARLSDEYAPSGSGRPGPLHPATRGPVCRRAARVEADQPGPAADVGRGEEVDRAPGVRVERVPADSRPSDHFRPTTDRK